MFLTLYIQSIFNPKFSEFFDPKIGSPFDDSFSETKKSTHCDKHHIVTKEMNEYLIQIIIIQFETFSTVSLFKFFTSKSSIERFFDSLGVMISIRTIIFVIQCFITVITANKVE